MFSYQKTEKLIQKLTRSLINDDWDLKIAIDKRNITSSAELSFKKIKITDNFQTIEFKNESLYMGHLQDVIQKTIEYHIHNKVIFELCRYFKKENFYDLCKNPSAIFEIKDDKFSWNFVNSSFGLHWSFRESQRAVFYLKLNSLHKSIFKQARDSLIQEQLEKIASML